MIGSQHGFCHHKADLQKQLSRKISRKFHMNPIVQLSRYSPEGDQSILIETPHCNQRFFSEPPQLIQRSSLHGTANLAKCHGILKVLFSKMTPGTKSLLCCSLCRNQTQPLRKLRTKIMHRCTVSQIQIFAMVWVENYSNKLNFVTIYVWITPPNMEQMFFFVLLFTYLNFNLFSTNHNAGYIQSLLQ